MVRHLAGRVLTRRFALLVVPLLALLVGGGPSASAQSGSPLADQAWVRLGGPPGGLGYDIRMRPDNPDIMYVTDAFSGVHVSRDGGRTWTPSNEGIDGRAGLSSDAIPVFSLTIDPNNYDILWVGLQGQRGIYRSVDGGRSWERMDRGIHNDFGITIRGFAVEPGNSNVVYAAGELDSYAWSGKPKRGVFFDLVKGVIYKTTDGGLQWKEIWRGDNLARYVWIDPTNHNTLYASTGIFDREAANSDPAAGSPGGVGVIKSLDGGLTWNSMNAGLENLYIGSLFMHPLNPQILLAGAGHGLYREGGGVYLSENGGESWRKVVSTDWSIMSVEISAKDPDIYYAAGALTPLYVSLDGGKTWSDKTPSYDRYPRPYGYVISMPIDIQVDPRDPARIFMNNYQGGNYLSEDGGDSWGTAVVGYTGSEILDIDVHPNNPAILFVNGRSAPSFSTDGGATWQGINPTSTPAGIVNGTQIAIGPNHPKHIIVSDAGNGFTFMTDDLGASWKTATDYHEALEGVPQGESPGMDAIAFAPSNPNIVYGGFASYDCTISRMFVACRDPSRISLSTSRDGGKTWEEQTGNLLSGLSVTAIVVHPQEAGTAWAAAGDGRIFRTTDVGVSWEPISNDLSQKIVKALVLDPNNTNVIFAGTTFTGVYKSENGGVTWRSSSAGMDLNEPIISIAADPARMGVVYAGSLFSGVFVSLDGAASWKRLNEGLRTKAVLSLAIAHDGNTLYAGTLGEGVFRLSTHDQSYFDSLQPTPTPTVPPPPSPTPDPFAAPILVDGNGADWSNYTVSGSDEAGDHRPGSPDLGEIRALNDSRHFYLSVKLHEEGVTDHYDILLDTDGGDFDFQLSVWPERNQAVFARFPVVGPMEPIQDVATAQGDVIEVELPLSALGNQSVRRLFVQTYLGAEGVGDQASDLSAATLSQATATPSAVGQPTTVSPAPAATQPGGQAPTEGAGSSGGGLCGGAAALPLALVGLIWLKRRK